MMIRVLVANAGVRWSGSYSVTSDAVSVSVAGGELQVADRELAADLGLHLFGCEPFHQRWQGKPADQGEH
ncbi:hypothetical protein ACFS07_27080 [Undibacterium arcticum]